MMRNWGKKPSKVTGSYCVGVKDDGKRSLAEDVFKEYFECEN